MQTSSIDNCFTDYVFTTIPETYYNLRNYNGFRLPFAKAVYHGTESISYLGPKTWDIVSIELENPQSLNSFKKSTWKWIKTIALAGFVRGRLMV